MPVTARHKFSVVDSHLTLHHTILTFNDPVNDLLTKTLENIVGKGENAGLPAFFSFPPMFSTLPKTNFNFSLTFILSSANALNLDQSQISSFGKELICRLEMLSNFSRMFVFLCGVNPFPNTPF